MTPIKRPEVADPELRAALEDVGAHIENYTRNLDLISKDVRAIEQYLSDSGIRLTTGVTIGFSEDFTDGDYDVAGNYSGGLVRSVQRIEWGADNGDEKRWRLMYVVFRRFGSVDIVEKVAIAGPTFRSDTEEVERRPLIETPATIRLQASAYLAKLVSEIGRVVEYSPLTKALLSATDDETSF